MRRLDKGAPIREAMQAAGLDIPRLAARTKELDDQGKGLSPAYVGFIVGAGKSAREETSKRAAELIAGAVGLEVIDLFTDASSTPTESTSTRTPQIKGARTDAPLPEQLMDQAELARFLRKSTSWIDTQIAASAKQGRLWPGLIYVGRSRRFDPRAVLTGMRRRPAA
ncbi:hypothetical protein J3A78_003825 [Streptomyces sp. PvR006]|uniref:hypothetical protein n=1 Tax=Streptomyces sp. PvR006 TaxID=2817860 RepID=UPI001AE84116|nr:hypothetical protein [Streptomyces sp. PvR006]MBP2583347.1 hypothetical protein [Streptomyces sp. PvR006]